VPRVKRFALFALLALIAAFHGGILCAETAEVRDLSAEFGRYDGAFVLYAAARDHWVRHRPDRCAVRSSPCSTFKVPNTLIALETGVASGPEFPLKWDGITRSIEPWNRDQTLRSAFAVSCVWYYQELARRIGLKPYEEILPKLGYGNADLSGGLTQFWLQSSLEISPDEQVEFLRRLHARKLPFSDRTVDALLDIMTLSKPGDAVFRGKTGSGGSTDKQTASLGWFVGSVSKPSGDYVFATRITGGDDPSGRNARAITESILAKMGILPAKE
jgi:beta-lactamase class D